MTQKSLNVTWHDHLQHLSGLFQDLYENKKLVDVTLYCTGGSLKAHKIVLSACSPYFAKIFQENEFKHPVIILKGISYEEMHMLLEFMYKGSINILENELDSLIEAGSYLEIKGMNVKNIPSNMKSSSKRPADENAEATNTKKIKEDSKDNDEHPKKAAEKLQSKEAIAVTKEESIIETLKTDLLTESQSKVFTIETTKTDLTTETPKTDLTTETPKTDLTTETLKTDLTTETSKIDVTSEISKTDNTTTEIPKTNQSHRRETRFKGQKRVDVHMFSRPLKGKLNDDFVPKSKSNNEDISPSPKVKSKSNNDANKGKLNHDETHFRNNRTKLNSVSVTVKKEKQDNSFSRTLEKLNNDDVDVIYPGSSKTKLTTIKKAQEEVKHFKKEQPNTSENNKSKFEDNISKIVIKDVYSTDEPKLNTSTPIKTYEKAKATPVKKESTDNEKEFIPVIPDVIMNESDSEINYYSDGPDHDFDDDDDAEEDNDHLKISHLECSQCNKMFKTDEELSEHMKVQHNKRYQCDYCDSLFQRHSHLVRHRRTHTGEKPFSCRECGKCFSRQDKLKQHIRQHDVHEYKPPPHLKKIFEPPSEERRGRGRPRKYPYEEKPKEKRPRGRPRKFSLPAPGEHVENYDITNLPFGDFSYLTSPLPDFSDLTIIPVCQLKSNANENTIPVATDLNEEKEDSLPDTEIKIVNNTDENTPEKAKASEKSEPVNSVLHLNECAIKKENYDEEVSIINVKEIENESQSTKIPVLDSVKHLSECTIQAVPK